MNSQVFATYRHSGKFGVHGPVLAIVTVLLLGMPLGFAYAYVLRWIPFIYINFFIPAGYGFGWGVAIGWLMKFAQVRNTKIVTLSGFAAGVVLLYWAWNAHVHAVFTGASWICRPEALVAAISQLYETGSWTLKGVSVTGIPLAIVWVVEAGIVLGLVMFTPTAMVAGTPFCEKAMCWLDEEKKIGTLAAFTDPAQVTALRAGDLGPLTQARPRAEGSATYTRLTLKHSPKCTEFCTVKLENISQSTDKKGNTTERIEVLTKDLKLPGSMRDLIAKFEEFKAVPVPAGAGQAGGNNLS